MNLEAMLESLASDVEFPATPSFAIPVAPPVVRRLPLRPWLVAAAIVLAILSATLAVPEARHAVADWLGIGSIRIEFIDDLLDRDEGVEIDSSLMLGERVDPTDLQFPEAILGLPDAEPAAAFQRVQDSATMITLLYPASDALPEIGETGFGAVLMQVDDPREVFFLIKETRFEDGTFTDVGGANAFWIDDGTLSARPYDPGGMFGLPAVSRATGNVLIWEVGRITYRLETGLDQWSAIRLAESLVPLDPGTNGVDALYGRTDSPHARKDLSWLAASLSSSPSYWHVLRRPSPPVAGHWPNSSHPRNTSAPGKRSRSRFASCSTALPRSRTVTRS